MCKKVGKSVRIEPPHPWPDPPPVKKLDKTANLADIPTPELKEDLTETIDDIHWCEMALGMGIKTLHGGESVQERLNSNKRIKELIEEELRRREEGSPCSSALPMSRDTSKNEVRRKK